MDDPRRLSRRRFFRRTAALAAGGVAMPYLIPASALASAERPGANERIGVGFIGVGRRGGQLTGLPGDGQIVAAADVDRKRAEAFAGRHKCRAYQDYRKMLEGDDLDAVIIATPDHWHVLAAIHACQAGKDMYVEKPLSLTVREGRILVDAVRKHKRVLQTGSQRRSMSNHRIGCELVRNGRAGKIHTVIAHNYPSPWECGLPGQPVPDGLDWDLWCGPTEPVPYHQDIYIQRAKPGWISFRPWSGGEMTGNGTHGFDQIQWALDMDHTGPVEVWAEGGKLDAPIYTEPETRSRGDSLCGKGRMVTYRYANGVIVKTNDGLVTAKRAGQSPGNLVCGALFIGDRGEVFVGCNAYGSNPPEIAKEPIGDSEVHLPVSNSHFGNWFESIRSREKPIADVEIGHRSAILCHLGNIARWVGRKLRWDPETETFPGDDEANQYLDRPRRKGYELPEVA
jgi:predicted dehydrogenase